MPKLKKETDRKFYYHQQHCSEGQEKCSDDGQMDGYMQEKEIYTEVVKSNIEYDDYALWAEDSDGYMTVEELDEIVQMIVRAIFSRKKT